MAQELPYFRFTVQEWQNGNISLERFELQGLFISICGFYWLQDCSVTLALLQKKFSNAKLINELIELGILKHEKKYDKINIDFLMTQFDLLSEKRKLRQSAGSKGGNAKAMLKQKHSYKDKDKDNNKDKDNSLSIFDSFRKKYLGTKKGNDTEFKTFVKHQDWKIVLPMLETIIENQIKEHQQKKSKGVFVPEWKNLQTWLNQRCWEQEVVIEEKKALKEIDYSSVHADPKPLNYGN